jgi:uncharacterized coiled-coil protein SlyX
MSEDLHLNPFHARLIEVETALAFQQKLVDDLNATVQTQNQSLYQLENKVRALQEQLSERKSGGQASSGKDSAADNEDYSE